MDKIKPLGNRVVIRRSKSQKTKGGIILPDTAQEKPKEGEIVAVGPGARDEEGQLQPLTLKVGDHVFFSAYSATSWTSQETGDEEFLIVSEDEVVGVL